MSDVEKSAETKSQVAKIDAAAQKAKGDAAAKADDATSINLDAIAEAVAAPDAAAPQPAKKASTKTVPARKPAPVKIAKTETSEPATEATAPAATNPATKIKDTIMATVNTANITETAKEVFSDVHTRAKTAAAKGTVLASEATEFTKANVEAVVESGKIFFAGAQELLKDNVETGKTVIETVTQDVKKVAAVKSPTELFQLQGEIARRNFDAMVSYGSKRTEAWVKLYNDAFAPISNRVSVAVEKVKTAA
ncbi:phasin family protein [Erythrobacter neustonensis]|uniref:Phasin domain-containing protein n=1 Tax=Erythrobacter neustonensis TaxID=1112 RepID=A0A192D2N8_9SPHN|nr:phasin family protein [Erythrobacter neustonensis]ANK12748.1 hypothetical protein A9D12_07090 [Erythrobacter neustonensis]